MPKRGEHAACSGIVLFVNTERIVCCCSVLFEMGAERAVRCGIVLFVNTERFVCCEVVLFGTGSERIVHCGVILLETGIEGFVVRCTYINGYQQIARMTLHSIKRERVVQTAVYQDTVVECNGFEEAGNGDRGADGRGKRTAAKHHFLSAYDIRSRAAERNGQVFYPDMADETVEQLHEPPAGGNVIQAG